MDIDDSTGGAAEVPGQMTQPEGQEPAPMNLDAGADLTQEEQEAWNRSQIARAEELGLDLAAQLTAAKEEAAATEASKTRESAGKG
eukprot:4550649-Heterocapsa_arctica.AAC.1